MEQDASKSIIELLGKINQYQNEEDSLKFPTSPSQSSQSASSMTELSDGKEQGKKNKVNIDENYFHHKLQYLLEVPKRYSFANLEIVIKNFLTDIQSFIDKKVEKNCELNIKEATDIKKEIEELMNGENKIELDSVFFNVSGVKINKFLASMNQYSFPKDDIGVLDNENYLILVESTHSLNSTIIKKTQQLRKYYLFFSMLDKYINKHGNYLGSFGNHFVEKYFSLSNLALPRNFLVLIVTNKTLKLFKETMNDVNNKGKPKIIQDNVKKCFPELFLKSKTYKNEINRDNENDIENATNNINSNEKLSNEINNIKVDNIMTNIKSIENNKINNEKKSNNESTNNNSNDNKVIINEIKEESMNNIKTNSNEEENNKKYESKININEKKDKINSGKKKEKKNNINKSNNKKSKKDNDDKTDEELKLIKLNYGIKRDNSLETFNYLINEINKIENWFVKVIYLDLYFDLTVPKCDIGNDLKNISQNVINNINHTKKLEKEVKSLGNKFDKLLKYLREKEPSIDLSQFMDNPENLEKEEKNEAKKKEDENENQDNSGHTEKEEKKKIQKTKKRKTQIILGKKI